VRAEQQRETARRRAAEVHAAALEQDANVFDYDGWKAGGGPAGGRARKLRGPAAKQYGAVYNPATGAKVAQPARYIGALKEKADKRKREQELVRERMIAKRHEAERAQFGDTEVFVTSGYRAKLEEDRRWQEELDAEDCAAEPAPARLLAQSKSADPTRVNAAVGTPASAGEAASAPLSAEERGALRDAVRNWTQRASQTDPSTLIWVHRTTGETRKEPPPAMVRAMALKAKLTGARGARAGAAPQAAAAAVIAGKTAAETAVVTPAERTPAPTAESTGPRPIWCRRTTEAEIAAARERYLLRKAEK
jgi:hypothetical protein